MPSSSLPTLAAIRKRMVSAAAESGLTYQEIGESMGSKETTARKLVQKLLTDESANFNPRIETLLKFAKAVNKSLGYFF